MGRKTEPMNYHVEVDPGRLWRLKNESEEELQQRYKHLCDDIRDQIKRHVNDLGSVQVAWENEETCEFCESFWTEGDSPHNGGCCEKDIKIMEKTEEL